MIAFRNEYVLPLPLNHRFPMSKYELLPQQLLYEGTAVESDFFAPEPVAEHWILRTHDPGYWHRLRNGLLSPREVRRTGFPWTAGVVDREVLIAGGTLRCTEYARERGVALNIAGGTHHAFPDRGEGFCLLNDIAIAANYLLDQKLAATILVIDLDVHQGNGTAAIFQNEDRVFTFSMHGANNYPLMKETSDLDIALADGTSDRPYLNTLDAALGKMLDEVEPDFLFYQAGVDILATDKLGKLNISREGCRQRDKMVFTVARANKIPIVVTMGGGYSPDFRDIIEAHANTFRLAMEMY